MQPTGTNMKMVFSLIVHQLISIFGVIAISGFLVFFTYSVLHALNPVFDPHRASWILTEIPGFPVQATLGLLTGYILGWILKSKAMLWVWLLPLFYLVFGMVFITEDLSAPLFSRFFGYGCGPAHGCFEQLMFTLPFLASSCYAIGALLSKTWSSSAGRKSPGHR